MKIENSECKVCGNERIRHYRLGTCSTKCYLLAREQKTKKGFQYKPNGYIENLKRIYEVK